MALKVPQVSLQTFLNWWLQYASTHCVMWLYRNDYVPQDGDTLSNYVAADFPGFASVALTGWTAPALSGGRAFTKANPAVFTNSTGGGSPIFGYFVTDSSGTALLWAERDPSAPVSVNLAGQSYIVNPQITARSEF